MFSRQCIRFTFSTRILIFRVPIFQTLPSKSSFVTQGCRNSNLSRYKNIITACQFSSNVSKELEISTKDALQNENQSNSTLYDTVNQEDLLEKFIAGLSSDIHVKHRVYKKDVLRVLNKIIELNFSTKRQGLLLLSCCTELLPDETTSTRMNLVEQIWRALQPHTKFTTKHYNELLRVYIANKRTLNVNSFIQQMAPMVPDTVTYELFLQALAEAGDLNQATEVIANMKSQNLPATDNIFNSLIHCQGKSGNLTNINEILTMMKSLKLEKSIDTYTAVVKALAWNKKTDLLLEEMEQARKNGLQFQETHIMDIVKTLSTLGLYTTVPKVLQFLPKEILDSPSISPYMQSVTTQLVFQNHPIAALDIYKCLPVPSFGPKDDKGLHGRSLVRDCVKASLPSGVIGLVTQELMSSGRNPIALQNACEAALQQGKVPLALDLFTRVKQLGLPLRPHYFWPIFIHSAKSYGEKGIMNTLSTMTTMEVKPDYDTILNYTLPYVSFSSPQNLIKKFLEHGMTVTTVLTPIMESLLFSGQVKAAAELSALFKGKIEAEKLLRPLLKGYLTSLDAASTVRVLQEMSQKSTEKKDWVGRFLSEFASSKKFKEDISDFKELVKALKECKLHVSTAATDYCIARIPDKYKAEAIEDLRNNIISITDEHIVDDAEGTSHQITHPKKMNDESLHSHLLELEAKGMNTRGVLRRLLQKYCRQGDLTAARDVLHKCQREGVFLSAGMKASIFDLYVKLGELELAEESLADLNSTSPNFTLDEFKIIDFATLVVYRNRLNRAFELIVEQSKNRNIMGGRSIEPNCWRLLDAIVSNGTPEDVNKMFHMLNSYGYCKPTNVILGPLVKVHLKCDDIESAVSEFVRLSTTYNQTPLKHELLCKILVEMSDGHSEDNFVFNERANSGLNKLALSVLGVDRRVHGASDVQLTVIAALAEVGYKKTLRRLLQEPAVTFHPEALLRRCERFAAERKVAPLAALAECARGRSGVDVSAIYHMMLDVHQREDDTQAALSLWYKMQEDDIQPSHKFIQSLCNLLKANNKNIPPEILMLLNNKSKRKIIN